METCLEDCVDKEDAQNSEPAATESELGFGTDYEKVIFAGILSKMAEKYRIQSYVNFPRNGLLGNTKDVTKDLPEKNYNPDLLWNFCEFENEADVEKFFSSVESFNPKYVLIVTQNWRNPGVLIHFLYHKVFGKKWDHGNLIRMTIKPIEEYSRSSRKYEILEKGLFDAPWFILDVYETGRFLKRLVPESKRYSQTKKSLFECAPTLFRKWASHHNYILLKRI